MSPSSLVLSTQGPLATGGQQSPRDPEPKGLVIQKREADQLELLPLERTPDGEVGSRACPRPHCSLRGGEQ
jgi:hypothetical protein